MMSDGERALWDEAQRDAAPELEGPWFRRQTARVPHLCGVCLGRIEPGTPYDRVAWLEDGALRWMKQHTRCPLAAGLA